ncbi:MAG TPA: LON peptidase substrate-binding domain-containing protein [Steroidobacteraceae bacterium]|nr:LON peptidase substrate-binding domain-containing protein [Steroidobacteraceae bacterium]
MSTPETATRAEIPLFPLNTVLFPGGPLPLRIFEARYIDLVRRCLREDTGFGVVLIAEGEEAGTSPTETCDVGTYARIVDFSGQPDGLLGIEARGERRFRIHARSRARDGLHLAEIEWLPEEPSVPLPDEFADLGPALGHVLEQIGEPYESLERRLDDAAWVGGRLAEILPLPPAHKQHCLELDDPVERLRFLRPLFEITTEPPERSSDDDETTEDEDEDDEDEDDERDDDR